MFLTMDSSRSINLVHSFGLAALLIVAGVTSTWVVLKRSSEQTIQAFPEIARFQFDTAPVPATQAAVTWIQSGDDAYAAGRIVEPQADNALYYFEKALEESPGHEEALIGLERVSQYLRSSVESAIFRGDWDAARKQIALIQDTWPGDVEARLLLTRVNRFEELEVLMALADRQVNALQLTEPEDANALATYRKILSIEPENAEAQRGIQSIAQRLLGYAQSAALAGEQSRARGLIAKVKNIDARADGLAEAEKLVAQWTEMVASQQEKDQLESAAAALEAGRLAGPGSDNALALFDAVLSAEPDNRAAMQGKRLVAGALLQRAWSDVRAGRFDDAEMNISLAVPAGANPAEVSTVQDELIYQRTLARARQGEFDSLHSLSELDVRRREMPEYPRNAVGDGWAEVGFTVSETGEVVDAKVLKSSHRMFEESAVDAINHWRFKPMMLKGGPIPVRSAVRFAFNES